MELEQSQQLAADIAANVVKATATTTARDLQINTLELNYKNMFEQNTKEHTSITATMEKGFKELGEKIDEISKNKANKWVESLLVGVGYVIGVGFLGYIGTLIYKATIALN